MACWLGCRDSKIRGFPEPLIARSCEEASVRSLLLLPGGSWWTRHLQPAPLECLHPQLRVPGTLQGLPDPALPRPRSAQVRHRLPCAWLRIQAPHGEHPSAERRNHRTPPRGETPVWKTRANLGVKMRTSLGAETVDSDTKRSGCFPSCTGVALWVILPESL